MPKPSCISIESFMEKYNNYINSTAYAISWLQSIKNLGTEIQADVNFSTALSEQEQVDLQNNMTAAAQCVLTRVPPTK